jgi:hypothetical protein
MLPFYHNHLAPQLAQKELLLLNIVLNLLQIHKWVRLETLANRLPIPITFESRRKKLQRFLSLEIWDVEKIWFPILAEILERYFPKSETLYIVPDRTRWKLINIFMVSLVYKNRAIPLYFKLLNKKGNSSATEQIEIIEKVIPLLKGYKKVILGDREFGNVDLAKWLRQQEDTSFVLRVRKNEYIEKNEEWIALENLGLKPGMSLYYEGVKVTKTRGFSNINIVGKWKRNYRGDKCKEPWFLLTDLTSCSLAIAAYKKRMGIEEMFRDFKKGGYNLEDTQLTGQRLISLLLLITLAYIEAVLAGDKLQDKGVALYVGRTQEPLRQTRRHSRFYLGLYGRDWLDSLSLFIQEVEKLLSLSPQKHPYYQRGRRAAILIQSAFLG